MDYPDGSPVTVAQIALETRLAEAWARTPPLNTTVEEAFGPYETWILAIGDHKVFLHPAHKAWFYLDPVHDTWEPTGFGPGEVAFIAVGPHLGYRRTQAPLRCPQCGVQTPHDSHFCAACGTRLEPSPAHCPTCGHDNRPTSTYCTRCGAQLRPRMEAQR